MTVTSLIASPSARSGRLRRTGGLTLVWTLVIAEIALGIEKIRPNARAAYLHGNRLATRNLRNFSHFALDLVSPWQP